MKPFSYNFILFFIGSCLILLLEEATSHVCESILHTNGLSFSEGLFWDCDREVLLFVDKDYFEVHRFDPQTNKDSYITLDAMPSFVIPSRDYDFRFILNEGTDLVYLFWPYDYDDGDYYAECLIATVDYYSPGNRLNDGKADFYGNIVVGSYPKPDLQGSYPPHKGSLFHFNLGRPGKAGVTTALSQVSFSNDVTWTSDYRIMYFSESDSACIYSFNYDLITGTICNCEVVFCFSTYNISGTPDGLTLDRNGHLWIAANGAGLVLHFDPNTRTLLEIVPIPVSAVTDVEFGGPDLDILFVSTRDVGDPLEPLAGSVFKVSHLGAVGYCSNYAVMNSDCTPEYFT